MTPHAPSGAGPAPAYPARVVILGLVANAVAQGLRAVRDPQDTDYTVFLAAARILRRGAGCLYCESGQSMAQTALRDSGHLPSFPLLFYNPPPAAWILEPLTVLSLAAGLVVFTCVLAVGLVIGTRVMASNLRDGASPRATPLIVALTLVSLPASQGLALGQWDPLLALAGLVAISRLRLGHHWSAGLALGMLLMKPQDLWLVVVALLAARCWRALAGVGVGAVAWVAGSLLLVSPGELLALPHLVVSQQGVEVGGGAGLPALAVAVTGETRAGVAVSAAGAVLALGVMLPLRGRLSAAPELALMLGVAFSLLLSPHVYPFSLVLLAVPMSVWARQSPAVATAAAMLVNAAYLTDQVLAGGAARTMPVALLIVTVLLIRHVAGGGTCRPTSSRAPAGGNTRRSPFDWCGSGEYRCASPATSTGVLPFSGQAPPR